MGRKSLYHTRKDAIVLAIKSLSDKQGKPPTLREISKLTGVSISTLHGYLDSLEEEGLITCQPNSHRTIRLTREALQQY